MARATNSDHLLIVEFFGLPGAGKTTLQTALVARLNELGFRAEEPRGVGQDGRWPEAHRRFRAVSRLKLAWRNRRVLPRAIWLLMRSSRSTGEAAAAFRFFFVTLERYAQCRLHPETVFVFDEGTMQRLFMLFVDGNGIMPASRHFIDSLPFGDALVHVSVEPEVALDRIAGRARGLPQRLAGLPKGELIPLLSQADTMLVDISDNVRQAGGQPERLRVEGNEWSRSSDGLDPLVRRILAIATKSAWPPPGSVGSD